jgi:hypothetical protein
MGTLLPLLYRMWQPSASELLQTIHCRLEAHTETRTTHKNRP